MRRRLAALLLPAILAGCGTSSPPTPTSQSTAPSARYEGANLKNPAGNPSPGSEPTPGGR